MNNIRNHFDRRNRYIHNVINDENKHFTNEKKDFANFANRKSILRRIIDFYEKND
jgi:ribosomal protein S15P/S13E